MSDIDKIETLRRKNWNDNGAGGLSTSFNWNTVNTRKKIDLQLRLFNNRTGSIPTQLSRPVLLLGKESSANYRFLLFYACILGKSLTKRVEFWKAFMAFSVSFLDQFKGVWFVLL